MEISVRVSMLNLLQRRTDSTNQVITNALYWRRNEKAKESFQIQQLRVNELEELTKIVDEELEKGIDENHNKWLQRKIKQYKALSANVDESLVIKKLDQIPVALKSYMASCPRKWVFTEDQEGAVMPYVVENCQYFKPIKGRRGEDPVPAHTDITICAYRKGAQISKRFSFDAEDLPQTIGQLLGQCGLYLETEEAVKNYIDEVNRYFDLQNEIGTQMLAYGVASSMSSSYYSRSNKIEMVREGVPTKVVLDDSNPDVNSNSNSKSNSTTINVSGFWESVQITNGMGSKKTDLVIDDEEDGDEDEDGPIIVKLPIHPYLKVYDLEKHNWIVINTANLKDYPWNGGLIDKLILPKEHKDLVKLLTSTTRTSTEDIISGKMPGVIVLATGLPGLGKTLTAEVFSEVIEKPLYTVQCSQLGLNVSSIEDNLKDVMKLASRWSAILLIDEADVYIREREKDIAQNAIVGVFLRVLEYYRGVLFMTSNRGESIDDAIISRATAWIKYEKPGAKLLKNIWTVLGEQYGVKFSDSQLDQLIDGEFENISGRTVRNLLKLAHLLAKSKDIEISVELIKQVAQYQKLS